MFSRMKNLSNSVKRNVESLSTSNNQFEIVITKSHIDFFREKRIFIDREANYTSSWLKIGSKFNVKNPITTEPYTGHEAGPSLSNLGAFSYTKSYMSGVEHGRYCAIGPRVIMIPQGHATDRLSCCGFDYSDKLVFNQYLIDNNIDFKKTPLKGGKPAPRIEHDVWIGADVHIARGITIGTGAIIATKSVVTKDVPPYALVAGIPAVVKKYRFPPEIIERLLASKWWEYAFGSFAGMDTTQTEKFLNDFEKRVKNGDIQKFSPEKIRVDLELRKISSIV
jgi:acetyltransferase-like isoleucine patch superfamily enzyme